MCSTPQIKLPTKSPLQHTLKLQTRAQNLNNYCVIVVVALYIAAAMANVVVVVTAAVIGVVVVVAVEE